MWKMFVEWGRPHDNIAHAHCMLDTEGYKYTHSQYVILTAFHSNNVCTNVPQCYVIRTLPVLYYSELQSELLQSFVYETRKIQFVRL